MIWGASGHASVIADIIHIQDKYRIVGFIDNVNSQNTGKKFCGSTVLGGIEVLDNLENMGVKHLIFGFGKCKDRLELAEKVCARGFLLAKAIHPRSIIATNVDIGLGTVIAAGAVINTGAWIGDNVIVNTSATIDHNSIIEDGVHVCPGVNIAGDVRIGRASWIGIGTTVIDKIRIGSGTLIGAGSLVLRDIPDDVVAYGIPAKVIKDAEVEGNVYG